MRPVDGDELVRLCETHGCRFDRQRGDHLILVKPGLYRPVVIPRKKGLREDIVLGVGRSLGLSRKELEAELDPKKRRTRHSGA